MYQQGNSVHGVIVTRHILAVLLPQKKIKLCTIMSYQGTNDILQCVQRWTFHENLPTTFWAIWPTKGKNEQRRKDIWQKRELCRTLHLMTTSTGLQCCSEFNSPTKLWQQNTKQLQKQNTILLKLFGFCQYIFCTATAVCNVDCQKICNSFPPFTTQQSLL